MKRSQATTTASSCSSTSSSPINIQSEKKRVCNNYNNKHPRRNLKSQNFKQNNQTTTTTTSRRSSIYRGVTRHRWTGRFEAHLWDKTSWNNIQNKKGRQVYLGAYDSEEAAARTYDLAALKYWGMDATLNFPIERYVKEVEEMEKASKEEYLASLRRQSSGFSRGISKYRGVARHHHNGRWEARIGRVCGNKYLYLGTYKTQEEAAVAYDLAAIEHRGVNAVTNFDINNYIDKLKVKNEQPQQIEEQEPQAEEEETAPNFSDSENAESLLKEKTTITKTPPAENHHMIQPQQHAHEESSLVTVMDHVLEQDLPWSFMYSNSSQFQVTSLGLSKAEEDLMNMFDGCSGFEEDIDFLFSTEAGYTDGDVHISEVLDGIECGGGGTNGNVDNNNINKQQQQQQQQKLLSLVSSSSSSPSSTTTVSCNYSL